MSVNKMREALNDLIQAHDFKMGKSAIDLRIELARDAIKAYDQNPTTDDTARICNIVLAGWESLLPKDLVTLLRTEIDRRTGRKNFVSQCDQCGRDVAVSTKKRNKGFCKICQDTYSL